MIIVAESHSPKNKTLWEKAKKLAKKKFNVAPSAYYANEWAERWYKKHGGNWSKTNEGTENMTPRDKIKQKYVVEHIARSVLLNRINEEIVNPENAGTMTKAELSRRDHHAATKNLPKNHAQIKGDTAEESKYRFWTYITLKNRNKEKGKSTKVGKKKKK